MIKIAVCDDQKENLDELCEYMEEYFSTIPETECKVYRFTSGSELKNEIKKKQFDVFFLDVLMPDANGMEIGQRIREIDQQAIIVYVTVSREYAFEAFGVRAFQYLQKPVNREKLFELLRIIVDLMNKRQCSKVCIRTKKGLVKASVSQIMYVENINRCAVYMMEDGTQIVGLCNRSSFEKSISQLHVCDYFVQPHKSYVVNMYFIRAFCQKSLELEDGTEIAISRNRFPSTKKSYLNFLAAKGELL